MPYQPSIATGAAVWHNYWTDEGRITELLNAAFARAKAAGQLKSEQPPIFTVEAPRDPSHGDAASNLALTTGAGRRQAAARYRDIITHHLDLGDDDCEVTIAGPGFINFRLAPEYWHGRVASRRRAMATRFGIRRLATAAGSSTSSFSPPIRPDRLTVGHGRNAVLGDTLVAAIHQATGYPA